MDSRAPLPVHPDVEVIVARPQRDLVVEGVGLVGVEVSVVRRLEDLDAGAFGGGGSVGGESARGEHDEEEERGESETANFHGGSLAFQAAAAIRRGLSSPS